VVLADDHKMVLAGIGALVRAIEGATVVAEAGNGREAVEAARAHAPDLVIMDIAMRELNGIDATARIRAEAPATRVLILSMHAGEDFVRRALRAGATGYLVKDSAPFELRTAIEAMLRGETYITSRVSGDLLRGLLEGGPAGGGASIEALTPRQREILQLTAEGRTLKEIAFMLDVSRKTVESHRAALMERLGIHDVAGLTLYAVRHHLVSVDRPGSHD
jgi:DNA-binding NarL/FixJ family response regulator